MKKALVLITGGAGFIGSHTADHLAKEGFKIRILDNLSPPVHQKGKWPKYVQNKGYDLVYGDVTKKADLLKALKDVGYVLHLAAYQDQRQDFSNFFKTNTFSSALLYEIIVEKNFPIKKVVLASSQFVYGDGFYQCPKTRKIFQPELRSQKQLRNKDWAVHCHPGHTARYLPLSETQAPQPTNSYGLSKIALEQLGLRLGKTYDIPTAVVRYSIVQGPRQSPRNIYSGALRIFASQAFNNEPITVFEDGKQKRDFVNVSDVAQVNALVMQSPKSNFQIFNIGGGKAYSVLELAKIIKQETKSPSPIAIGGYRRTDTRHAFSSIQKIKALGWRPSHRMRDSVRQYIQWVEKTGLRKKLQSNIGQKLKQAKIYYE